jgi:hypothetical protein
MYSFRSLVGKWNPTYYKNMTVYVFNSTLNLCKTSFLSFIMTGKIIF